jgi:hypothetical protein
MQGEGGMQQAAVSQRMIGFLARLCYSIAGASGENGCWRSFAISDVKSHHVHLRAEAQYPFIITPSFIDQNVTIKHVPVLINAQNMPF